MSVCCYSAAKTLRLYTNLGERVACATIIPTSAFDNNKLFMAPHLVRAENTYKDINICSFN